MGRQSGAGAVSEGCVRGTGRPDRWRRHVARAELTAVPEVRRAVRELLRHHWTEGEDAASAELCATELVTNALVHTDRGAVVTATVGPAPRAALRVEVRDFTGVLPTPREPTVQDGTHGRGLMLVQTLADSWGVSADEVGKVVWFELATGRGRPQETPSAEPARPGMPHIPGQASAPGAA
ncbi:ATP-binding protein [Streptomyces sp. NPDC047097]|uniref:ATP-binding protein n=1 Tax=Streptomyces sp. NPDC047097 TaxID=3155260 RepID=UPI0033CC198D